MKESKFIELLNLYIDQQISPQDARLLEEEIAQDPQRRRVYQQYCKMHRACSLVFENFRAQAQPAAGGAGQIAAGVVDFQPHARRIRWGYYAAGLAAAGFAVAVVGAHLYVRHAPASVPAVGDPVAVQPVHPAPDASLVRTETPSPRPAAPRTEALVNLRLSRMTVSAEAVGVSFASGNRSLSQSLPAADSTRPTIEQFVFEQTPAAPAVPVLLRTRYQTNNTIDRTAYQFQR
jgi:hypothetical protein